MVLICPSGLFIYIGFDIIGQMSFGESFGCLERGELLK